MQRIINSKTKKARARQERSEKRKVQWYARRVIRFLSKQYKKTGNTVIDIDVYKFNEDKLVKVLQMLQAEKQITYIKSDDLYTVTILLPKTTQHNIQPNIVKQPEKVTEAPKEAKKTEKPLEKSASRAILTSTDEEEYKPF